MLRTYGYCYNHLPDVYRCHATTSSGKRCMRVTDNNSDYCKLHKRIKAKQSTTPKTKKIKSKQPSTPRPYPRRVVSYAEYIDSAEWKAKAKEAKKRAGYRCQICNKAGDNLTLNAHHRTYKRLGNELPMDITVLCRDCHAKFHDKLPESVVK